MKPLDKELYLEELVTDQFGNVDTDFYRRKAEAIRKEYLTALYKSTKIKLAANVRKMMEKVYCPHCQPSH